MSVDTELDLWRREWQAATAPDLNLHDTVRRQSRLIRVMLALDILVTVVFGAGFSTWAVWSREADVVVLAIAVWGFLAIAWSFAIINRRGCWTPSGLDTQSFVEISIRRARAAVASTTFGAVFYFGELAFCVAWVYHRRSGDFPTSGAMLGVWAATAIFLVLLLRYRRKKQAQLRYLQEVAQQTR